MGASRTGLSNIRDFANSKMKLLLKAHFRISQCCDILYPGKKESEASLEE